MGILDKLRGRKDPFKEPTYDQPHHGLGDKIQDLEYAAKAKAGQWTSEAGRKLSPSHAGPRIKAAASYGFDRIRREAPGKLKKLDKKVTALIKPSYKKQLRELHEEEQMLGLQERRLRLQERQARVRRAQRQYSSIPQVTGFGTGFQPGPVFGQAKKRGKTLWN